jgi:hypothetical protein
MRLVEIHPATHRNEVFDDVDVHDDDAASSDGAAPVGLAVTLQ